MHGSMNIEKSVRLETKLNLESKCFMEIFLPSRFECVPAGIEKRLNVYLPSLVTEVPDHVYDFFCFLTASTSVSAILVTRCAFNTIL
jgi:hypothetical protein